MPAYQNILLIQTAFTGDAILGTALLESLHTRFPQARISYLVRKGNEGLFAAHPFLYEVLVFNKSTGKLRSLKNIISQIRRNNYDLVINLQRFASSGLMAGLSGATEIIGFEKNPFSFLYNRKCSHSNAEGLHEIERNHKLIVHLNAPLQKPKLYPSPALFEKTARSKPYICLAPASVWETKQWPAEKWAELIQLLSGEIDILLIGGKNDHRLCEQIISRSGKEAQNMAGQFNLLESAALISKAALTVSNDSGPVHLASAMNAPLIEIYCSTVPQFGFFPLSDRHAVIEVDEKLPCRPCGLHGKKACPLSHFKCGNDISAAMVFKQINRLLAESGLELTA